MQETEKNEVAGDAVALRELAARIVSSEPLKRSPRLCELFLYLFEHSLTPGPVGLNEQRIGESVFGRPRGYDTSADNIVRASVFQLRKKLEAYFSKFGEVEPVVITIPKGHYMLDVSRRAPSLAVLDSGLGPGRPSQLRDPGETPRMRRSQRLSHRGTGILLGVIVGVVALGLTALVLRPLSRPSDPATNKPPLTPMQRFWEPILCSANGDAYIVPNDAGFGLLQDFTGVPMGLKEFLHGFSPEQRSSLTNLPPELTKRLTDRPYTSVSVSSLVFLLGAITKELGGRAVVRSARGVNIRDLNTRNVVLLGSSRSNPWVDLISERMNFRLEYEGYPPKGIIRNMAIRAPEPAIYRATASASSPGATLGLIAFQPNLNDTGSIVIIAGTTMEGTEAAAEMLLRNKHFERLLRSMNVVNTDKIPHFEAVISATSIGGGGSSPEILTVRRMEARR